MFTENRRGKGGRGKKMVIPEKFVHPANFISNLHKDDEAVILKAAKMSNCSIYIDELGYNRHGQVLKDTISVYSAIEGQDLSEMWIKYSELKKQGA